MNSYIILGAGMILLPAIYICVMMLYQPSFENEKNRTRKLFHTLPELLVLIFAEAAWFRIWKGETGIMVLLLYTILAGMMIVCMTDYWETIVPNKILLIWFLLFVIIVGGYAVWDMEDVLTILSSVILGFLFSLITFGLGYFLSRKNMGAGDVKLSLLMGLYLTGEHIAAVILYGCLAAAGYSLVQLMRKKLTKTDAIPFVPFLYTGLIIRYLLAG